MSRFVHLTPARLTATVRRGGLGAPVYCFPVLPSHTLTYQWARELRRRGAREFVAVTFVLPDSEPVDVGHYGKPPERVTAARAVAILRTMPDPRGYEVVVPRRVTAREVRTIRPAPRVTGWRYMPAAHGRRPCACPGCLGRGQIGAARLRRRLGEDGARQGYAELLAGLRSDDPDEVRWALWSLGGRGEVADFAFLAEHPDPEVRDELAEVLTESYRGPAARALLERLTP
ncbi:HEAT repeat domain-containing protein [Actinoplanes oblitus]|uniref:HEAT repeat domain-containing protein n=1 Tax=Actinoplanes oblitus TaxID=3040509 RepID=A0ABY8W7X4_9ACTN|nr:HEAT repeat domain-containing protein [Actinoplanes oblitus]WIM93773.1 HEAT repeat domain-containing protein [Actinoplanes oblitus]